jgi:hypothetical protein
MTTEFPPSELIAGVEKFWSDKETRNRLMHDEWYVAIEEGPTAVPSTRGIPRVCFWERLKCGHGGKRV